MHVHMRGRQKVENRISRQTERAETSVGPRSTAAFPPCHLPAKLIVSAEATSFLQGGDGERERGREMLEWRKTHQLGPPSDVRVGVNDRLGAGGLNCIIANQLETYYEPYVFY